MPRIRRLLGLLCAVLVVLNGYGQREAIRNMSWGSDYNLHIQMGNDSAYVMDVRALYHERERAANPFQEKSTTYFPVSMDRDFVSYLRQHPLDSVRGSNDSVTPAPYLTLWGALHSQIGGGYVHLINCIIYALEGGQLRLQSEALERPTTQWKPDPPTESYLRTKNWQYSVPTTQKDAHREYKLRVKEATLQDLQGIPDRFISLFLKTSDKGYRKLVHAGKTNELAQIDLVRMMLGAKYLGEPQIRHISGCVREAVATYTAKTLPTVIVFDDYKAAVAMALDSVGYRVDYIVFQNQADVAPEELKQREEKIRALVHNINLANENLFRQRLSRYYNF